MGKVRMLAIAPYDGMRLSLLEAARHRDDIEMTVYVGDMDRGAEIVKGLSLEAYDVILSRGGTARMIREETNLPTVEILPSVFDIMRSLRFVQNYTQKLAIVGFPSITNAAYMLNEFLQTKAEIVSIHGEEEALATLERMKAEGFRIVIGDMITCNLAQQAGLDSVLITSGPESIEKAFDSAVEQCKTSRSFKQQLSLIASILKKRQFQLLVYDQRQRVVLNTLDEAAGELLPSFHKRLIQLGEKGRLSFVKRSRDKTRQYAVEAEVLREEGGGALYIFCLTQRYGSDYTGLDYVDEKAAEARYLSSFSSAVVQTRETSQVTKRFLAANQPVFITGERGTGKDSTVYSLYLQSIHRNSPMLVIDCALMEDKGWRYLLTQSTSPLQNSRQVIYLKNCAAIPEEYAHQLLDWMLVHACAPCKCLFFSCDLPLPAPESRSSLVEWMLNSNHCLKTQLAPLRRLHDDFENLVRLCIRTIGEEVNKRVTDIEPGAMEKLRCFDWPENDAQLRRVLSRAILAAEGGCLRAHEIQAQLEQEARVPTVAASRPAILEEPLTLREIERRVVQHVLAQENHNQTRTAQRLGISRSTLWRMLSQEA